MNLPQLQRTSAITKLKAQEFDVLIIGGGITGAGIALDAASRGLCVALIEKSDFAYGTSSRSTKLIHGGLRYLKQLEFGLVKEVGSERAIVHGLAPHLVVPEKMLLPLHEKKGLGYWLTSVGLRLYDFLAGVKAEDQRKMLTRSQTLKSEPLLKPEGIKGGALYAEYRTDDARLTIEIIKASVVHGASVANYVEAASLIYDQGKVTGAKVIDRFTKESIEVKAIAVVNATGPWADEIRAMDKSLSGKRLQLTKGVHIVVARERLPVMQAIYFDVDDGRMIFAIPRGRTTYIGTTDTSYAGKQDEVRVSKEDAQYLINAVNSMFPSVDLSLGDVESSWAGLRPLIHEDGKSPTELSRKDEIFESPSCLISIAGGKLTGYRKMAERVINLVIKNHFSRRTLLACHTDKIMLAGSQPPLEKEKAANHTAMLADLLQRGVPPNLIQSLLLNFGSQSSVIMKTLTAYEDQNNPEQNLLESILDFCVQREMVFTLSDFFIRRTALLYFDITSVLTHREFVAAKMANYFSWDATRISQEQSELNTLIRQARLED